MTKKGRDECQNLDSRGGRGGGEEMKSHSNDEDEQPDRRPNYVAKWGAATKRERKDESV
jgi:hypothetical protein